MKNKEVKKRQALWSTIVQRWKAIENNSLRELINVMMHSDISALNDESLSFYILVLFHLYSCCILSA